MRDFRPKPTIYCGVWPGSSGHYEHTPQGVRPRVIAPWTVGPSGLDGGVTSLLAGVPLGSAAPWGVLRDAPQHVWRVWHEAGCVSVDSIDTHGVWTLLAAWDRTGDPRAGSFSAFVLNGRLTTAEAIVAARSEFPIVWARIDRATSGAT